MTPERRPERDSVALMYRRDTSEREVRGFGCSEIAVLGLLGESPMHGYELRKRLATLLGTFRAFSYGSLYPTLRRLAEAGWISEETPDLATGGRSRRGKRVYQLTAEGKERLAELLADVGPDAYEDEGFGARLAFFAQTRSGRAAADPRRSPPASRGAERRHPQRARPHRQAAGPLHAQLQEHGLESADREVRWLNELIDGEQPDTKTDRRTDTK